MSYANPSVWGTPETWIYAKHFNFIGNGDAATKTEKPKTANFGDETGTLAKGDTAGKTPINTPIDSSICPCRQDPSVSCFGNIALFKNKQNASENIIPDNVITSTEPCKWFMYNGNGMWGDTYGHKRNWNSAAERWSPDATLDGNFNAFVTPFVYWQINSILISVEVATFTSYNWGPSVQWKSLADWKNNFSDRKICNIRLIVRGLSQQTNTTITYQTNTTMADGDMFGFANMDYFDNVIDYAAYCTNSRLGSVFHVLGINDYGNYYDTDRTVILNAYNMFDGQEVKTRSAVSTERGWLLWYEIPYSDDTYEKIMKMTACFGCVFTNTGRLTIPKDMIADDVYIPIIEGNGVTQGRYTHGEENANNPIYKLKSIFGFEPDIYPIDRPKQISVYDISEPQNGFKHNGLAILMPIECISDKEDAGRWDLTITHPLDDYKKWTYIVGQNVLKVNGQLFRIDETEIYQDANEAYITAHAKHISYDLFDRFVDELTGEAETADYYIYKIIERSQEILPTHQPEPNEYLFEVESDIDGPFSMDIRDQTVIGALFGDDNSILNRGAGQLYRDNFHMSINTTMENAPATPAFQLRYGTDLTRLSYKIDFSNWVTELICKDNLGDVWAVSYTGSEWIMNNQKTRVVHFTYDPETPDPMGCLAKDGFAYWQTVSTPTVSIEVSVAQLKNDPKYKDFVDLQNLDVGYVGTVYIEQLNIDIDLKIVSIRRDEITGEALQVVLGTARGSFIRSPVMSQTIVASNTVLGKQELEMQSMQNEIVNLNLKQMRTWGGMSAYKWADVQQFKWEEIYLGRKNSVL